MSAEEFTAMLRTPATDYFTGLAQAVTDAGFSVDDIALADTFDDDESLTFNVIVTRDGKAFTFTYRWEGDAIGHGQLGTLKDISDSWQSSPYSPEVSDGRRLLGLKL